MCFLISLIATSAVIRAASTRVFRDHTFADFLKGENKTTSLSGRGVLTPAPEMESIWKGEDQQVWRIISGKEEGVYFSTGNEGRIYYGEKNETPELFCDLEETAAFALAIDKNGVLYAGASPGGKIYRIAEKNKPEVFFETEENYIWDLVFDSDGNLFAATGSEGKLFRIEPDGDGEVYYETTDKNIMDILILRKVRDEAVYLATHDKGRIYRVMEKDSAFVLFDSGQDEVRAIVEGEEGYIYAAMNTSKSLPHSGDKKDDNNSSNSGDDQKSAEEKLKLLLPILLGQTSSIIKMDMAGYVWPMLQAPESPIHTLSYDSGSECLYAGIGDKGRYYRIHARDRFSVVLAVEEKHVLSQYITGDTIYFASGEGANIYSLKLDEIAEGTFISDVQNAGTTVKWGNMQIESDIPAGTSVKLSTRSGNTEEPDKTWSEWTREDTFKNKFAEIKCPAARFMQYKLILSARNAQTYPVVKAVNSFYAPPNRRPIIQELGISPPGKGKPKTPRNAKTKGNGNGNGNSSSNGSNLDAKAHSNPKGIKITWKVSDPEDDQMRFALYFKAEDEQTWKEIEDKLEKPMYEFSTASIPDGRYRIKLAASDLPSNPESEAEKAEMESEPFTVDNTPPEFTVGPVYEKADENSVIVSAGVRDETSIISSAQYAINAGDWFNANPDDVIFDSPKESFSFVINDLKKEEMVITFMVTDAKGNTSVSKVVVNLKK